MTTRRSALTLLAAGIAAPAFEPAFAATPDATARIRKLETDLGGRIGVSAVDTGSGRRLGYRAGERFPMCSTFKALAAAAILHRVDTDCDALDRRILIRKSDPKGWSPVTETHVGQDMTLEALCAAAVCYSDNGAGNLLLGALGGPAGLTGYVRSLGDKVTRLDRWELELNRVPPGDPRDTTSPAAMQATLAKVALGKALAPASRDKLVGWLVANTTGDDRLRAGVPKAWKVGDKTGTGPDGGGVNDIAVLWPPGRAPIMAAVYTVGSAKPAAARSAAIAEIGRIIAETL
ncbi:class A beta-lactamase [Phenylobacterium soli]|uniref:Beta-lactamase n=1 Tax=Phenylobacterium soli TaxID=2170551 RepID=A0A328AKU4_9CAUL|nr:class A beta-lactamase [Phenylobacterium soli]RAK54656.1 class A beta-lactamase [Phenylobacterium soli]